MQTWLDLERRFRTIADSLTQIRLDAQWGAAGESREIVGAAHHPKVREFVTLCGIGGRLLERSLDQDSEMGTVLFAEPDPIQRWYLLLVKYSGAVENILSGYEEADGERRWVYSGTISEPVSVSANQCLEMEVKFPVRDSRKWYRRLYDDYGREIVIGTILTLITLILGLFFG